MGTDCKANLSDGERSGTLILSGGGSPLGRTVLQAKFATVSTETILYKIYKYAMMYMYTFNPEFYL